MDLLGIYANNIKSIIRPLVSSAPICNVDKIKWTHWDKNTPSENATITASQSSVRVIWVEHTYLKHYEPKEIEPCKPTKQVNHAKIAYYAAVWKVTERNAKNIRNIHLRGKDYHIDHIVPISYGFKHSISPLRIGGIKNLRIVTRKENFKKNRQFTTL